MFFLFIGLSFYLRTIKVIVELINNKSLLLKPKKPIQLLQIGARMREKRGSRFSDVRDARNPGCLTHVTMFKNVGLPSDIGLMKVPETITESTPSGSLEKKRKKSSASSSDDDASSNSEHRRKHKKHKKGKSKRSSRRDEREYERYKRDRRSRKSERSSIESKSSIRSDRSETKRRSRSRDRHRRY